MKAINVKIKVLVLMMIVGLMSSYRLDAQTVNDSVRHRPKVGVVLCGGGAKGLHKSEC